MLLWEMTSPNVDALPRDVVVLIPVASCEQHSLHLPVWTDSYIGQEVARRIHERVPDDVLVLPVQWLGYSQHHSRYPGTASAVSTTHLALMMDTVDSMVRHGFRKILQNSILTKIEAKHDRDAVAHQLNTIFETLDNLALRSS